MKLDDDDRAALAALRDGPTDAAALAGRLDADRDRLAERLAEMADNDLVEAAGGGTGIGDEAESASVDRPYALTDSGRRVLAAPGDGSADDRIDVPTPVEDALSAADLRADEESALRAAVAFLQRGDATPAELATAIYPEEPADRDGARAWWRSLRGPLATLPGVESPDEEDADGAPLWRYAPGDRETGTAADSDGRAVMGSGARKSLRRATADLDLTPDERTAVRVAVERLFEDGPLTDEELAATHAGGPAGYDSPAAWLDGLAEELAALPGVDRPESEGEDGGEGEWRFDPPGAASPVSSGGDSTGPAPSDTGTPGVADGHPDGSDGGGSDDGDREPRTDGGGDGCPVCGRAVDGRVYIDADETVLSASRIRTCVKLTPSDRTAGGGITLFYHGRGDGS